MKQFYATLPAPRWAQRFLFFVCFLLAFGTAGAQVYFANLSGSNEQPPTPSAGTGKAMVTINGNWMRVQVTFSGLTGNTTASHIHAPTAVPQTGTVGVATTVPTFAGFPLGVQAGTYDHLLDMTLSSSYNPSYMAANGGTPLSAFAALKAALAAGRSYLNVHTNVFPGGEIRGFLLPCPTITVSIPDAFALDKGVLPNTVYPAYAPASSLTLQANASGGNGAYRYTWSTGSTASSINVSPMTNTPYTVMVHDENGCPSNTATKLVTVMDVSSGKKGDKIDVCHNGRNTLSIAAPAVAAHLEHGDLLGSCDKEGQMVLSKAVAGQREAAFQVKVLSNPTPNQFELQLSGNAMDPVQLRVFDLLGRVVETRTSLPTNQRLRLGASYRPGTYLVQMVQGEQIKTLRLIKTK